LSPLSDGTLRIALAAFVLEIFNFLEKISKKISQNAPNSLQKLLQNARNSTRITQDHQGSPRTTQNHPGSSTTPQKGKNPQKFLKNHSNSLQQPLKSPKNPVKSRQNPLKILQNPSKSHKTKPN